MEENLIDKLIGAFMALPGVGFKTAQRYAHSILTGDDQTAKKLSSAILLAKENVHFCSICGGFSQAKVCPICRSRFSKILCVIKSPQDINVMERVKNLHCNYHVLHGTISPLSNKGPDDIRLKELLSRLKTGDYAEVIVATNPDVEGEATALYISKILKPLGIKVTRLAQGIAIGSDLEYADEVTLSRAIETRREM